MAGEALLTTNQRRRSLVTRGGRRGRGRRFGGLPVAWLGEGVGDEAQELGNSSGHRRDGGGRGNGEHRRWACSVAS